MHKVPVITIFKDAFFKCLKHPFLIVLCLVAWGTPYIVNYFLMPKIQNLPTNENYRENIQKTLNVTEEEFNYEAFQKAQNASSINWQKTTEKIWGIVWFVWNALLFALYIVYLQAYDNKKYNFI